MTFPSYEEALTLKTEMLSLIEQAPDEAIPGLEVKIARCGPAGTKFKVKAWSPTGIKKARKSKKQKKQ